MARPACCGRSASPLVGETWLGGWARGSPSSRGTPLHFPPCLRIVAAQPKSFHIYMRCVEHKRSTGMVAALMPIIPRLDQVLPARRFVQVRLEHVRHHRRLLLRAQVRTSNYHRCTTQVHCCLPWRQRPPTHCPSAPLPPHLPCLLSRPWPHPTLSSALPLHSLLAHVNGPSVAKTQAERLYAGTAAGWCLMAGFFLDAWLVGLCLQRMGYVCMQVRATWESRQ